MDPAKGSRDGIRRRESVARDEGGPSLEWAFLCASELTPGCLRAKCEATQDRGPRPWEGMHPWHQGATHASGRMFPSRYVCRQSDFHQTRFQPPGMLLFSVTLPENLFPPSPHKGILSTLQAQHRHTSSKKSPLVLPEKPHYPTAFHVALSQNVVT